MRGILERVFGRVAPTGKQRRPRHFFNRIPRTVYVIGDIHGCLKALLDLERKIVDDAAFRSGIKLLVYLGDYVDRGPSSAQVISHLLKPPPRDFRRICIAGNHEEMFLEFIAGGCRNDAWLEMGGLQTLTSYGVQMTGQTKKDLAADIQERVPATHLDFLAGLPSLVRMDGYCFVHAGIDPATGLEEQKDRVLMWSRPGEFTWPDDDIGFTVIHGHTPVTHVEVAPNRINVDTGAFMTDVLSAVRITSDGTTIFTSR
ncbi:metallophosphoesterase family protein [Ciceribacter sp. L1K22]|uniref:metallophosphoesterase family protein n=1 Tax=Ciceribacter sp. L1K22 TaxID=2820275 RepID=UPI001ABDCE9F|nr:metallophosphoesterase family protein [Ciceribacter sp. L1K22]MBO3762233.1 serine/threonine protein phosphatase [Ciceribacter sp. L1K22]